MADDLILVTGASGAVGGQLTDRLRAADRHVRVSGRRPETLVERWPGLDAVELDVLRPDSIAQALDGVRAVVYLVHSMEAGVGHEFHMRDAEGARNLAQAARAAGVARIVYLSGLGDERGALSKHLWSRQEVGRILAAEGPEVIELRAAMVISSDSASFRMLTDFIHRLPAMVLPRWAETPTQPIAGEDVFAYLEAALDVAIEPHHPIVEIGMPEVMTYRSMLERVAARLGRSPMLVEVPVLTPKLSSYWAGLTTSVSSSLAQPLIEGLATPTVVTSDLADRLFPDVEPMGFEAAVDRALAGRT
ncbi:MAG: NAD(P)H-binding protein [Actinomycetota bacterium]